MGRAAEHVDFVEGLGQPFFLSSLGYRHPGCPGTVQADDKATETPDEQTVSELLRTAERLLADERARGQALDTKTASLAGFAGAILALTATLGGELLKVEADARWVGQALFAATIIALAVGAVLAVGGVLTPQSRLTIDTEELRDFGHFPLISTPRMDVQGMLLNTLVEEIATERRVNWRKAVLTRLAAFALVAGFVGVAALGMAFLILA